MQMCDVLHSVCVLREQSHKLKIYDKTDVIYLQHFQRNVTTVNHSWFILKKMNKYTIQ